MTMCGMKTDSIFERYHIRDEKVQEEGADQHEASYNLPEPDQKVVGMGKVRAK